MSRGLGDVYKRQQHSLRNAGELDTVLAKFPHVKYLLCGHIHQELDLDWNGRRLLATPSTCVQFKPHCSNLRWTPSRPAGVLSSYMLMAR